jgi:hypothetical protein
VTAVLARGRPGPEAALERCLDAAGLPAELSPRVRDAALVSARLPGGRAQVFVYPSAARARAAAAEVETLLRRQGARVAVHGPAVVALIGAPERDAVRALTGCADRLAGSGARLG